MIFKNLLRIMLSSLLLVGSATAYAEGETTPGVLLKDGKTTVSWADFAKAINYPTKDNVKGTLPKENAAQVALDNANQALTAAQDKLTPYTTKQPEGNEYEGLDSLGIRNAQLEAANGAKTDYIKNTVTPAKNAYDDAVALLGTKTDQLNKLKTQQSNLNSKITSLTGDLQGYSTTRDSVRYAISDIKPTVETTTAPPTIATWLSETKDAAVNFYNDFVDEEDGDQEIYYLKEVSTDKYTKQETINLSIAYKTSTLTEAPNTSWAGPVKANTFDTDVFAPLATRETNPVTSINRVTLYLGQPYYDVKKEYTLNVGTNVGFSDVFLDAKNVINTLTSDGQFQVPGKTTTTETYTEAQQQELDRLNIRLTWVNGKIAETQAQLTSTKRELEGYTPTQAEMDADETLKPIVGVNNQINTLQGEIDNLNADSKTEGSIAYLKAAWDATVEGQATYEKGITDATTLLNMTKDAIAAINAEITTAQAAVTTAEAAIPAALFAYNYNSVTLTGNIEVTTAVTENAYAGTIKAKDFIITNNIGNNTPIFDAFTGTLNNAAVNGRFRETGLATFEDVAITYGTTYRYYNENGASTDYKSLGELGYAVRNEFGVNFDQKQLAAKTDATMVHNITYYANGSEEDAAAGNATQAYVTNSGTSFADINGTLTLGENVFAVAEDAIDTEVSNVIYPDGANFLCKNAVITDKVNFYSPRTFKATNLKYERNFNAGYNTVCLPFVLNQGAHTNISYVCVYDTETPEMFWFTAVEGNIEANTPAIIVADNAFTELNLSGMTIDATPMVDGVAKQIFTGGTYEDSKSWGTFKTANRDEFGGASNGYKVYGYNSTTQNFQAVAATVKFAPFRMALSSNSAPKNQVEAAPRRIGIRDEQGKEINIGGGTSAIEDVVANEAPAFSIKGGVGELTITSEANYGKVEIYSVDGRLAAVADVTEGTTSVSLQHGLYIVMGKKVIVK